MIDPQMQDWIKSEEVQGYTPDQLRSSLINQGFNPSDVDEALNASSSKEAKISFFAKYKWVFIIIGGIIILILLSGLFFVRNSFKNLIM
jgi:hypothetical protein